MSDSKVTAAHLQRRAYLYVRQSTLRQVMENQESTQRQYALRQRAVALGWPRERIEVIDCDQGRSGASAADREGFQHLVGEVGVGRAGIVMGLEVSRLARKSSDWHRLLELCALSQTLILDEDGVYDPAHFNDRLVLGLKGTMSEAELHVLRARLDGGRMNKVRRGEYRFRLPAGFVYDPHHRVVLDPDRQVQESVRHLFATFRQAGTVFATVRAFREQGLRFPIRPHYGPKKGELLWQPLTMSRVLNVLHNPRYAGAYAYGRRQVERRGAGSDAPPQAKPREAWHTLLLDAHPGYISWAVFEANQQRLLDNARVTPQTRRCPAREGPALLQGVVMCGVCGARMTVRYTGRRGRRLVPHYQCKGTGHREARPACQSIPGAGIDEAIGALLVEAMTPVALDVALAVQEELQRRIEETDRLRHQHVDRARFEADLARQRFMQVDPNNRLVADTLEADWNEKLRALEAAREDYERRRQNDRLHLDEATQAEVRALATDFPRLWRDPRTSDRDRKRMVRLLIEDVTLVKRDGIDVHVRFRGGATRSLHLPRPLASWELNQLPGEVVDEIDRLLNDHTHEEIAAILNARKIVSGTGKTFDGRRVAVIRRAYQLPSRRQRLRAQGHLTLDELATRLGVCKDTVKLRRREGRLGIRSYRVDDNGRCLYEDPHRTAVENPPNLAAATEGTQYE